MPRLIPAAPRMNGPDPRERLAESTRRMTELAARRASRRRALPRWAFPALRIAARVVPSLALVGLAAWGWSSGHVPLAMESARVTLLETSAAAGLSVGEVLVKGRRETDGALILEALGIERGMPMLAFDPHEAQARLEQIPWIASATVERHLPDTIFVQVVERAPMALWQHAQKLHLVDAEGTVLTDRNLERWADLPLLVGADAPARGRELLALLASEPSIAERVEAAVLVGGRRWDLRLDNGVDVRLPETGVAAALSQLALVQQTNRVLEKDIVVVDLRVPDRLVVQTSATAAERRRQPPQKI